MSEKIIYPFQLIMKEGDLYWEVIEEMKTNEDAVNELHRRVGAILHDHSKVSLVQCSRTAAVLTNKEDNTTIAFRIADNSENSDEKYDNTLKRFLEELRHGDYAKFKLAVINSCNVSRAAFSNWENGQLPLRKYRKMINETAQQMFHNTIYNESLYD